MPDLAEHAGFDDCFLRIDQVRRALALRADLHDALVLARRGNHRLALEHIHADRLLTVHIRARLHGRDHRAAHASGRACRSARYPGPSP